MGGLTVLAALRRELPDEHFIYLGDTARLPYGTKSADTVKKYARQAAELLLQRGVKAVVVACNTASGLALEHLSQALAPVPVFGVVQPGAQAAAAVADSSGVLVLATESTVQGGAYHRALLAQLQGAPVYARACPLWVTLAEMGPVDADLERQVLADSLRGFSRRGPRTLLLGCTHFPVFRARLQSLLPDHQIVDSAQTTALAVRLALQSQGLAQVGQSRGQSRGQSQVEFLATDGVARFRRVGGYFLGEAINAVTLVDI